MQKIAQSSNTRAKSLNKTVVKSSRHQPKVAKQELNAKSHIKGSKGGRTEARSWHLMDVVWVQRMHGTNKHENNRASADSALCDCWLSTFESWVNFGL